MDTNERASSEALLTSLRDEWIAAENLRTEAYRAFLASHKDCPFMAAMKAAEATERVAKERYAAALQGREVA